MQRDNYTSIANYILKRLGVPQGVTHVRSYVGVILRILLNIQSMAGY